MEATTHRLLIDVSDAQRQVPKDEGEDENVEDHEHPAADLHHVLALAPYGRRHQPKSHHADLSDKREGGREGGNKKKGDVGQRDEKKRVHTACASSVQRHRQAKPQMKDDDNTLGNRQRKITQAARAALGGFWPMLLPSIPSGPFASLRVLPRQIPTYLRFLRAVMQIRVL